MSDTSALKPSTWRTAKISADVNCVQVRQSDDLIVVRNSRFPDGPFLSYTKNEWAAFLDGAKKGEFDEFAQR